MIDTERMYKNVAEMTRVELQSLINASIGTYAEAMAELELLEG